jgi:hypothetical protein
LDFLSVPFENSIEKQQAGIRPTVETFELTAITVPIINRIYILSRNPSFIVFIIAKTHSDDPNTASTSLDIDADNETYIGILAIINEVSNEFFFDVKTIEDLYPNTIVPTPKKMDIIRRTFTILL